MENAVIKDVVLDKKFNVYGTNYNDFVAQSESKRNSGNVYD